MKKLSFQVEWLQSPAAPDARLQTDLTARMTGPTSRILDEPKVAALLSRLHSLSDRQGRTSMRWIYARRWLRRFLGLRMDWADPSGRKLLKDKLAALDPDKCRFCHLLCLATDATNVVEVGTSHGVSTIYLAAAVRENMARLGRSGRVIATEWEGTKAASAQANLGEAGLAEVVEIREGDVRETLRDIEGPIDFVLLDIWAPLARPVIDLLLPHLRKGALLYCDNVVRFQRDYRDYLDFVRNPANGFVSVTIPGAGGSELSIWCVSGS